MYVRVYMYLHYVCYAYICVLCICIYVNSVCVQVGVPMWWEKRPRPWNLVSWPNELCKCACMSGSFCFALSQMCWIVLLGLKLLKWWLSLEIGWQIRVIHKSIRAILFESKQSGPSVFKTKYQMTFMPLTSKFYK